jgi:hypothetical protein
MTAVCYFALYRLLIKRGWRNKAAKTGVFRSLRKMFRTGQQSEEESWEFVDLKRYREIVALIEVVAAAKVGRVTNAVSNFHCVACLLSRFAAERLPRSNAGQDKQQPACSCLAGE